MHRGALVRPALTASAFAALLLLFVIPYARAKPFWHDEIYTILLARLPVADSWRATRDGVDLSPPLNTWMTHAALRIGGEGPVVARLPAMAGFLAALLCVFAFARRRAGAAAAAAGALALFFTAGLRYAAEARGYGLMMGLAALILYAWSRAAERRHRAVHLAVVAAALAASAWTHYFAVFAIVPVLAGEAARAAVRRRLDGGMAAALAIGCTASAPMAFVAAAVRSQRSSFWTNAQPTDITTTYRFLIEPMLNRSFAACGGMIVVLALAALVLRREPTRRGPLMPAHETVALLAGLAIPLVGLVAGRVAGVAMVPRYALSALPALAILLGVTLARLSTPRVRVDVVGCLLLASLLAASRLTEGPPTFTDPVQFRAALVDSLRSPHPTVIAPGIEFLPLWYYAPPELKGRMRYVADVEASRRWSGSDTIDRGYQGLAPWSPLPVESYESFVERHRSFRVYQPSAGWLLLRLEESGAIVEPMRREAGGTLFQVTLPGR